MKCIMPKIQSLILQFANDLSTAEIPKFRGAVIASLEQNNILYHNHDDKGVIYKYPRIQYKRLHQKAAIVAINEGVEAIHELFSSKNFLFKIGKREEEMQIQSINIYETNLIYILDELITLEYTIQMKLLKVNAPSERNLE